MPAAARSSQVDLDSTPYYHCISRCVRRAFLCGEDAYTGENYDHRKVWLVDRLRLVAQVFAIDVCAFAIMSNHFHVVLRVDREGAAGLSEEALLRRYGKLFRRSADEARKLPRAQRRDRVELIRERLSSISWFMRSINEYIARRANREDDCTGRFWEGRFRSQPLLDEAAVLTCMTYVDLNPRRAGLATRLETADFTSIQQRLKQRSGTRPASKNRRSNEQRQVCAEVPLARFGGERGGAKFRLPIRLDDYVELVRWTAQVGRSAQRRQPPVPVALEQFGIDRASWLGAMRPGGLAGAATLGREESMSREAERRGKRWLRGRRLARALFVRCG